MEIIYSNIHNLFVALFGNYNPVSYTDGLGNIVVPSGAAGVNFEYVLSVLIFFLVVFEMFRLLGLFISRR